MIVEPDSPSLKRKNGFIVFEGVNGAGKSTVRSYVSAFLAERGELPLETFEPGDGSLGKLLRPIILAKDSAWRSPETELLLLAADRTCHVAEVIKPAISKNQIILCDRYCYSTVAFQGYGRALDLKLIQGVNDIATAGVYPDLVLLFDIDPAEGLRRAQKRSEVSGGQDSFESEELNFHKRIREGFLNIARDSKEPFVIVDASQPPEAVTKFVLRVISHYLR